MRGLHTEENGDVWGSFEWLALRESVLARDRWRCRVCGEYAEIAHHLHYYDGILCKPKWLISVCVNCHAVIHGRLNSYEVD